MPEGVGYGPQNTASVGLNLNIIGSHAYAYSGGINLNNETKTFIEFRTGNFLLVAGVQTTVKLGGLNVGKRVQTKISLNATPIMDMGSKIGATTTSFDDIPNPLNIIVPPYSEVKVEVTTDDTEGDQPFYITLTGRIHGKVD